MRDLIQVRGKVAKAFASAFLATTEQNSFTRESKLNFSPCFGFLFKVVCGWGGGGGGGGGGGESLSWLITLSTDP